MWSSRPDRRCVRRRCWKRPPCWPRSSTHAAPGSPPGAAGAVHGRVPARGPGPLRSCRGGSGRPEARVGGVTAIEVRHLVKRYRGAAANAVDDVSFDVEEGQLFCLLGPNGAGKTTTLSILTTTLLPTSGQVLHRGEGPGRRALGGSARTGHRLPAAVPRPEPYRRGEHPPARRPLRPVPMAAVVAPDAAPLPGSG